MVKKWAPVVLACFVAAPSLRAGLVLDDFAQRAFLKGDPVSRPWWDLYNLVPGEPVEMQAFIERGPFPWFSVPDVKLHFFRPLSSALLVFDALVFGDSVWLAHLHSVLWYLALVVVAGALYRRLVPSVALLAALLFAIDDAHTMPVMWLANRNSMVALVFAWLGLWAHLRWREDGWKPGLVASVAAYVTALLAGETAIAGLGYLVAYELVGRRDAWRTRLLALLPATAVVLGFSLAYRVMGMGAAHSATYLDPGAEPLQFLLNAPVRFLANFGGQSSGLPADVWLFLPALRPQLVATGVVALIIWPLAWRRWAPVDVELRAKVKWLGLGAFFALIPPLATFPGTRLMIAPSLGLMVVVAVLLANAWRDVGVRRAVGVAWLGLAFVLQPVVQWLGMSGTFKNMSELTFDAAKVVDAKPGERIVIVSTSEFAPLFYGPGAMTELGRPLPRTWSAWSMAPLAHRLTRVSERDFELESVGGRMTESVFEQNFRQTTTDPLSVGFTARLDGQVITVTKVEAGAPTSIHIELTEPPEAFRFFRWNGDGLEPFVLPEVGQTVDVPRGDTSFERAMLGKR